MAERDELWHRGLNEWVASQSPSVRTLPILINHILKTEPSLETAQKVQAWMGEQPQPWTLWAAGLSDSRRRLAAELTAIAIDADRDQGSGVGTTLGRIASVNEPAASRIREITRQLN